MFPDDDDEFMSGDEVQEDLEQAVELVRALHDSLVAGTTASINYKPDQARYRRDHSRLGKILKRAGIREPFPWPQINEALAAAKAEHYGQGSHRNRTLFFKVPCPESPGPAGHPDRRPRQRRHHRRDQRVVRDGGPSLDRHHVPAP